MSNGHSAIRRVRAVHYRIGEKPTSRAWRNRRAGWFGRLFTMTLVASFLGFTWAVRSVVLDQPGQLTRYSQTVSQTDAVQTKAVIATPAPAKPILDLQQSLNQWEKDHAGETWGVSVRSLEGPSFSASLHGDDSFVADGAYKLFVLLPLFKQMPLDRQQQTMVTVNGSKKTIAKCVDLMLRIADNNCGVAVGNYINTYKANTQFKQAGFGGTMFNNAVTSVKTTPNDTALLLASINGSLLDAASQKIVQEAMTNQIFKSGLPAGCPGCTMANNSGFAGDTVYDAAIVNYSQGKYIVAVYAKGGGLDGVAKIGGMVHQRVLDSIK